MKVWRGRADSNRPSFFRHGFVTVPPWSPKQVKRQVNLFFLEAGYKLMRLFHTGRKGLPAKVF